MGQGNKTRKSFLNKSSGKKDTLEVDYDNNTVTVEDDSGITFASFKNSLLMTVINIFLVI